MCNGALAGLVAVTAGCALVEPWAAIIIGATGACVCFGAEALLLKLRIDVSVGVGECVCGWVGGEQEGRSGAEPSEQLCTCAALLLHAVHLPAAASTCPPTQPCCWPLPPHHCPSNGAFLPLPSRPRRPSPPPLPLQCPSTGCGERVPRARRHRRVGRSHGRPVCHARFCGAGVRPRNGERMFLGWGWCDLSGVQCSKHGGQGWTACAAAGIARALGRGRHGGRTPPGRLVPGFNLLC